MKNIYRYECTTVQQNTKNKNGLTYFNDINVKQNKKNDFYVLKF